MNARKIQKLRDAGIPLFELHNYADGYQDTGTLEDMRKLGQRMKVDDEKNGVDWVGPYWITDEAGYTVEWIEEV